MLACMVYFGESDPTAVHTTLLQSKFATHYPPPGNHPGRKGPIAWEALPLPPASRRTLHLSPHELCLAVASPTKVHFLWLPHLNTPNEPWLQHRNLTADDPLRTFFWWPESITENYFMSYAMCTKLGKLLRRWKGSMEHEEVAQDVGHVVAAADDDGVVLAISRGLVVEVVDGKGQQMATWEVDLSS